jgi:hypothetical protein
MGTVLGLAVLTGVRAAPSPVSSGTDPESGLPYWAYRGGGISVRLVQRLPDQTRAFFMARGFDRDAAEAVALGCVFQTIVSNADPEAQVIEYDMVRWRIHVAGRRRAVKLKSQWDREWTARGLAEPARIAFRWSLLPTRQRLEPSDYNWGMSTFDLPPGQVFDLELVWHRGGQEHRGVIEAMRCASDAPVVTNNQEDEDN